MLAVSIISRYTVFFSCIPQSILDCYALAYDYHVIIPIPSLITIIKAALMH